VPAEKKDLDRFIENEIASILGLERLGLSIAELKQCPLLLLLDSYDEKRGADYAIYQENHLDAWNAKVIITCRTHYLVNKNYAGWLKTSNNQRYCREIYLSLFTTIQIDEFVNHYQSLKTTDLKSSFEKFPQLYGLAQ